MQTRKTRNAWHASGEKSADSRRVDGKKVRNVLLLRIPPEEFATIKPHLDFVSFEHAECLARKGRSVNAVYFPNGGIGSLMVAAKDGRSVEVGAAGREDMIGLAQFAAGLDKFTYSVLVQVPGDGFRIKARSMKRVLPSLPQLRDLLLQRLGIRSLELIQNAACNRLHNIKERVARWLLVTHDRIDSKVIRTTHDVLSKMVGTDRASVSVAAAELERAGVIRQGHASISIVNKRKLETLSCDCYDLFRKLNSALGLRQR
jgi:CRP-like cAMP-binding protein